MNTSGGMERRLTLLMAARLALSTVSLALAIGLEAAGWSYSPSEWRGFYGTVVFAFLATIVYGFILGRVRRVARFAAVNIATDIAIVSALVHLSGGSGSPFAFLYVLVALYGGLLFEKRGALWCALAGACVYGAVLLVDQLGFAGSGGLPPDPAPIVAGMWIIHTGAVALVAGLASRLSTELRQTGEALERRTSDLSRLQTLHRRTVESLMSGLLTTDPAGRVTSANPEAARITRRSADSFVGKDIEEILPGVRAVMSPAGESGEVARSRARIEFETPSGEALHLGVGAYVLRDDVGGPAGHVLIFQDVTEVVEMETSLRRSERLAAVGELSASIAHEVRNPLAAISGSIEMLQRDPLPEDPNRLMRIVLREVERLDHLITDFLHYARPGPRFVEPCGVAEAVAEVMRMFEAARPPGVEVVIDAPETTAVLADASQLRQVLWNLVLNAAQAMPQGGRIRVAAKVQGSQEVPVEGRRSAEVEKKERWVEISVQDEGVGIPESVRERIFDPFFTTRSDGTGLGLATVHRIVEDHAGTLRLESEEGRGTTVLIRLPAAEDSP